MTAEISLLHKSGSLFVDAIKSELVQAESFDWAVAFASYRAYLSLESNFRNFFRQANRSRVVFDITQGLTDPELIEELATMPGSSQCKIYFKKNAQHGFMHHKFYFFKSNLTAALIVGSNNFTLNSFENNEESSVFVRCDLESQICKDADRLFTTLWNSDCVISPLDSQSVLDAYRDFYSFFRKREFKTEKNKLLAEKELSSLFDVAVLDQSKTERKLAYFAGLIVGSLPSMNLESISNGDLKLTFKHAVSNKNTADENFIAARVDGELLGDVRILQRDAVQKQVYLIAESLTPLISVGTNENQLQVEDKSKKQAVFNISIQLQKTSILYKDLARFVWRDLKRDGNLHPAIPGFVKESADISVKRDFIRGYFDCRGRISQADRQPKGPLRIAFQISTNADDFGRDLEELMNNTFAVDAKISSGKGRGKDSLLRFIPNKTSLQLVSTNWKKLLLSEFIKYNEGQRYRR